MAESKSAALPLGYAPTWRNLPCLAALFNVLEWGAGLKGSRSPAKGTHGRSVAQPGSAPRSGRGGRRFKSCHSDQIFRPLLQRAIPMSADRIRTAVRRLSAIEHLRSFLSPRELSCHGQRTERVMLKRALPAVAAMPIVALPATREPPAFSAPGLSSQISIMMELVAAAIGLNGRIGGAIVQDLVPLKGRILA